MTERSTILMDAAAFRDLHTRLATPTPAAFADPDRARRAALLVADGTVVSCGAPPAAPAATSDSTGDRPHPYRLRQWFDSAPGWSAVNDRFEVDVHGAASMTHIDTTGHFFFDGVGYGGTAEPDLAHELLSEQALAPLAGGTVTRGVLLDVPALIGRPVTPGHVVTPADLEGWFARSGTMPEEGDALLIRFGSVAPRDSAAQLGEGGSPGLSIECAEWMHALRPAVVVTDHGLDVSPSQVEGVPVPWHLLLLTSLGVPLVDAADLEALSAQCARVGRWEFLFSLAPLDIPHASGSPVNPLAVF